jgi:hypothetical protein
MRDNEGFEIRVNGAPRTFRELKELAYEAARIIKNKVPGIVEIVDPLHRHQGGHDGGWPDGLKTGTRPPESLS